LIPFAVILSITCISFLINYQEFRAG